MKNKLIFTVSTFVLCSYFTNPITNAEAAHKSSHPSHHNIKHARNSSHGNHHFAGHRTEHRPSSSYAFVTNTREGLASYYSHRFQGRRTASGETYDMFALTAAHRSLPLHSYAEIRNTRNNKTVIVRINDRGPYRSRRILDLSYAAARELGIHSTGTGNVVITPLAMNQNDVNQNDINQDDLYE